MKLILREPIAPRYIYVNPQTNFVHLLIPIISGTQIGLDNTCKSVVSMQEFFGINAGKKKINALSELRNYKAALEFDLHYLPHSQQRQLRQSRLLQINMYIVALTLALNHEHLLQSLKKAFPYYPIEIVELMRAPDANLFCIVLCPDVQDVNLRTTVIRPVFNANHHYIQNGLVKSKPSKLNDMLNASYNKVEYNHRSKEDLIQQLTEKLTHQPIDFELIRTFLTKEIRQYLDLDVDFESTQATKYVASVKVTQSYIDEQLAVDENNPATHKNYITALIEFCAPNLFDFMEESPFYQDKSSLSLLTQFFLAQLNIVCRSKELSLANFGQILEGDVGLIEALADNIVCALEKNLPVEEVIIQFVNANEKAFYLVKRIADEDIALTKANFKTNYEHIKDSPHFDEFLQLGMQKGGFFSHQASIATHFAAFIPADLLQLDDSVKEFFCSAIRDFSTVERPENRVPHNNEFLRAEIELDLAEMTYYELSFLYDGIMMYRDKKLREVLLDQLKKERPEFINAQKFLQHVAFGQQKEAEETLLEYPELTQTILRLHGLEFTDYSGRTFECTAYEYAYWAGDTYMQRMLEKYIRLNDKTRQFILQRVKAIEEPIVKGAFSFVSRLFASHQEPAGLHYRTQVKGKIKEHREACFNFKPLIMVLSEYCDKFKEYQDNLTPEHVAKLKSLWIEEVGRAQRDVPAHVAQEYCQAGRDFRDVARYQEQFLKVSSPFGLVRDFRFINKERNGVQEWFYPGSFLQKGDLGISIAITRGVSHQALGRSMATSCEHDLRVISALEALRAEDRKQSIKNLSQPLSINICPYR